jgi:polyribonucleotide 5'-hydroxyl-kinase
MIVFDLPYFKKVVVREQQKRERYRMARTHEYFYGPKGDLSPHSTSVSFRSVRIFKVGVGTEFLSFSTDCSGRQAPSSALPIGAQSTIDPLEPREVAPSLELRHSVLGVAHVTDVGDGLLKANLQGFIYMYVT